MPTIAFELNDLQKLLGKKINRKELEDKGALYAKSEVEVEEDGLKLDVKDTNRPDLWSIEGVARELRGHYQIEKGVPKYNINNSKFVMKVDTDVQKIRPKTAGAVVKGVTVDDEMIKQMIQLQEKVAQTFGRRRKEVAIGVYDFDKIKWPIHYKAVNRSDTKFIPLDCEEQMTLQDILEKHPKGKEFAHLLEGHEKYPLMVDDDENVLSMPPVINSNHSGKVDKNTKNLFVEITGFDQGKISTALNVMVAALADRGGKIEEVAVDYGKETLKFPNMSTKRFELDPDYCRKILGIDISDKEIVRLLEQSRCNADIIKCKSGAMIEVHYPAYRADVMHARDIVEDVAIAFGYNDFEPTPPDIVTVGGESKIETFSDTVAEAMVGLGFIEFMGFVLTSRSDLFDKMEKSAEDVVEIENPVSDNWSILRNWMMPTMLGFIAKNKNQEYPQKVFEIGDAVIPDNSQETKTRDIRKLCIGMTDNTASYEEIASVVSAFMHNVGVKFEFKPTKHDSFIEGRVAEVVVGKNVVGMLGEIHPHVLENWNIEKPVIAAEIDISKIFEIVS